MFLQLSGWLTQSITVPLWGFLIALILPVAYLARMARRVIEQRLPGGGDAEAE